MLAILRDHADPLPGRLLFLWNLFEGVPKFYRDCYEQGVLAADRAALLRRIFFESSSPLRTEAESWTRQYLGVSPVLDAPQRAVLTRHDVIPQDLNDLVSNLE